MFQTLHFNAYKKLKSKNHCGYFAKIIAKIMNIVKHIANAIFKEEIYGASCEKRAVHLCGLPHLG